MRYLTLYQRATTDENEKRETFSVAALILSYAHEHAELKRDLSSSHVPDLMLAAANSLASDTKEVRMVPYAFHFFIYATGGFYLYSVGRGKYDVV